MQSVGTRRVFVFLIMLRLLQSTPETKVREFVFLIGTSTTETVPRKLSTTMTRFSTFLSIDVMGSHSTPTKRICRQSLLEKEKENIAISISRGKLVKS